MGEVVDINKGAVKAMENRRRFEDAEKSSGHKAYVKNNAICSRYYYGDQWDPEVKAQLDEEGRPYLTLNMFLSTINAMIGEQLDRKVDVTFTASRTGTEETAFALNSITKAILNDNVFDEVEEEVFADGIITDRGFYDVRMAFESNVSGDIKITSEDGVDIVIDGEAKSRDPATWNEVFISRWMTPDQIGEIYGEDLMNSVVARVSGDGDSGHYENEARTFGGDTGNAGENEEDKRQIKRVRVIERQYYQFAGITKFVDPDTGDMRQVPFGVSDEEAAKFAEENGYGVLKTRGRRLRVCISAGDVLLEDDWSMYRTFTIIPFFPYYRRGNPHGIGRHILDPQDLLNKTSSQELHIVNTTANSGWMVEENSLVDMDAEDLEREGAKTGLVITYKRNHAEPSKIQPNQIPTGIERISQKAALTIREISSINASMLGTARADQSGRAQEAATSRGQVQVSVVLASLKKSRRLVARKILELVQDFYTETRYFRTTDDGVVTSNHENQNLAINEEDDDGNILNDVSVGEYGITIGHAPAGGNAMEIEFNEALRLREVGVNIPDHFVIKYSNLRERSEVSEYVKHLNGLGEPTPEQQQLEQAQMQFQIESLQKQLQTMDADIDVKMAKAAADMAKAESQEGYNMAEMEIIKLRHEREKSRQDAILRIALAARSHTNQSELNDSRLATQVAMKHMDLLASESKEKQQPKVANNAPRK